MLRGVVTADLHLGGMGRVLQDSINKQITEIHKVYKYALENGIKHVFIPGDLSHLPRLDEHALISLITLFLTYDDHINTYYIMGNHDVAHRHSTALDLLKAISEGGMFKRFKVYSTPALEKIDGVDVAMIPFPYTEVIKDKRPPLVFAHIETVGALGDNGRPLKTGHEDDFKRVPGDFIISGHLHHHQYLKKKRIVYAGSLYQTNFGEALPKGFLDFSSKYVNGALKVVVEHIPSQPNFVLETKIISSDSEWSSLEKDESIRYRLFIDEGIVVPKGLTSTNKNIISIQGVSKNVKVSMESIQAGEVRAVTIQDLPKFSLKTGLVKFLSVKGLDKAETKRGMNLVKEALAATALN